MFDEITFESELSWDEIIASVAISVGILATLAPISCKRWQRIHPVRARYSIDPFAWDGQANGSREFARHWEVGMKAPSGFLVQISPHVSFHLKQVRGRFVQRKWLTQGAIWKWVIPSPSHIQPTALRGPFFETNSPPLYYFDGMQEIRTRLSG